MNTDDFEDAVLSVIIWLVVVLVAFVIASIVVDTSGRQDSDHATAIPSDVTQLSKTAYVLPVTSSTTATEICSQSNDGSRDPVRTVTRLPGFSSNVYVECKHSQRWEDTRDRSGNFADAMAEVISSWLFWLFTFVAGIIVLLVNGYNVVYNRLSKRETTIAYLRRNTEAFEQDIGQLQLKQEGIEKNLKYIVEQLKENDLI